MRSKFGTMIVCVLVLSTVGCRKDDGKQKTYSTITIYSPIYQTRTAFQASLNGNAQEPVKAAGKLYIKDQFIYLNEIDRGIHIIDNSNPSKPKQVAFLDIPGNRDIAIKGNTLYADLNADLLGLDISNPKKVKLTSRIPNFFFGRSSAYGYTPTDTSRFVVGWIKKDTLVANVYYGCAGCQFDFLNNTTSPNAASSNTGTAGSMASMVLMNDYLYAITERHSVGVVNIQTAADPKVVQSNIGGFDLETIFPFEGKLFMGSASGMFIYDVSNPTNAVNLGTFSHGRACDPVVADGDFAYVTLHSGTSCGGSANELNIVDVKDLLNPVLVKSYQMTRPTGLTKDGNLLFVCDGESGVRIYDATDVADLKLMQQIKTNNTYDVLAGNHHALVVAENGLYQYDYTDLKNIKQLSFFSLKN